MKTGTPQRGAPLWVRIMAGLAIVAFFVLFGAGIFGYYGWWMLASGVFIAGFGVAWVYMFFRDRDEAIDMFDE